MKKFLKYMLTGVIVFTAAAVILGKYRDYVVNPWTRNGQVRAIVIQVAPRVSGPIVNLAVQDNQFVKADDLLFEIDPRTFQADLDQARAQLDQTGGNVEALNKQVEAARAGVRASRAAIDQAKSTIAQQNAEVAKDKAEYERQTALLKKRAASQKAVERNKANYEVSVQKKISAEAGLKQARAAQAAVQEAELNLEFTRVRASVDGYVTNLNLRLGSQAVANQPALALVDVSSYWVDGFFKENAIAGIQSGDRAVVTLMTYPDTPLEGRVDSIGWGISQQDGSTGFDLLPSISPSFEWIRLAQRVPVRIHLTDVQKDIKLRVGATCSVLVMTGTTGGGHGGPVPAAPKMLQ